MITHMELLIDTDNDVIDLYGVHTDEDVELVASTPIPAEYGGSGYPAGLDAWVDVHDGRVEWGNPIDVPTGLAYSVAVR